MSSPEAKRKTATLLDIPSAAPSGVPEWMQRMREVAQRVVTPEVVEQIVVAQVERAKGGDMAAAKWVFDQVLGGAAFKGATIVQNNTTNHFAPGADIGAADPRRPIRQGGEC